MSLNGTSGRNCLRIASPTRGASVRLLRGTSGCSSKVYASTDVKLSPVLYSLEQIVNSFSLLVERIKRPDARVVQNLFFRFTSFYFLLFRSSVDFAQNYWFQCTSRPPALLRRIAARLAEFGRQPGRTEKFSNEYQDRILFGTDCNLEGEMYAGYFRWLETANEYFDCRGYPGQGHWEIYALVLPGESPTKAH